MPITKSAKKAVRKEIKRKARNLVYKNKMKKLLKEVKKLAKNKEKEQILKLMPQIYKTLDKTAKAGVIKKGTASRKKSRIAKLAKRI